MCTTLALYCLLLTILASLKPNRYTYGEIWLTALLQFTGADTIFKVQLLTSHKQYSSTALLSPVKQAPATLQR